MGSYACQWLGNVNMHIYAKFDKNIPCSSRVMSIFTDYGRTDLHSDHSTHQRVV